MAELNDLKIGTRVYYKLDGWVGNVEILNEFPGSPELVSVRWRTPDPYDEPSCVCSVVRAENLIVVDETVKSPYKDYLWWEQSKVFCALVNSAVEEIILEEEINKIDEFEQEKK